MTEQQTSSVRRVRVTRTTGDDRMVAGVCGGVARATGLDASLVRVTVVILTLFSGVGAIAYVAAALLVPAEGSTASASAPAPVADRTSIEHAVGVGLVTAGVLLLSRRAGLVLPDEIVWPVAIVSAAAAIAWSRTDHGPLSALDSGVAVVVRIIAGALLFAGGVAIFAAVNQGVVVAAQALAAVVVVTAGVVLLAGPGVVRLGRQLRQERIERARADERAEMAAHLHDSVLQTLAMIQRRAASPAETVALARRQERELRAWLNDGGTSHAPDSIAACLHALADEVEAAHAITVEVVVVGDATLDDDAAALVAATRESLVNAARHSGAPTVSVYGEIADDRIVAYVRDRGCGFEPEGVPVDRRGLTESVIARLARHGGTATVNSTVGEGTEVVLSLPRRSPPR